MNTKTMELDSDTVVDFIADILLHRGSDSYLGEDVTMLEHMLQAATLAEDAGADDELIAAALLHDIGHYAGEFSEDLALETNNYHDVAGATVLAPFFPGRVVECVRQHVAAKRYLCAVDPNYFGRLTAPSVRTLEHQGGPMNSAELADFEKMPDFSDFVRIRQWDEGAKIKGCKTPGFNHFEPLLRHLVKTGSAKIRMPL